MLLQNCGIHELFFCIIKGFMRSCNFFLNVDYVGKGRGGGYFKTLNKFVFRLFLILIVAFLNNFSIKE